MNEMNVASKRRGRRRSRRSPADGRNNKIDVSEFPKFLVKLVGWRWVWLARTEPKPRYRHD
jgi:hypothetical protein